MGSKILGYEDLFLQAELSSWIKPCVSFQNSGVSISSRYERDEFLMFKSKNW
jgi:hypothetical protein